MELQLATRLVLVWLLAGFICVGLALAVAWAETWEDAPFKRRKIVVKAVLSAVVGWAVGVVLVWLAWFGGRR